MVGLMKCGGEYVFHFPDSLYCTLPPLIFRSFCHKSPFSFSPRSFSPLITRTRFPNFVTKSKSRLNFRPPAGLPETTQFESVSDGDDDDDEEVKQQQQQVGKSEFSNDNQVRGVATVIEEAFPQGYSAIISACFIGLLTGMSIVLFNNAVHEVRDFFWDGIPHRGASWLREEPIEVIWKRVILVPACGGLIVSILNLFRDALEGPEEGILKSNVKAALQPFLKAVAACVTLGTGNSLGPEGPSVEIGSSIAKGYGALFDKSAERKLSLMAAGSAAGISSGFNAAVAGCFFAVESVLWPSPTDSSMSLTNTTSMVILSAVIASVVSQVGLGSEPAFKVPEYDFRSPTELPLYLLLGLLCGFVSLILSRCTSYMLVIVDNAHKDRGIPKAVFPVTGGLAVGLIALAYPEILYWGFENVDILLESRPFVEGLSPDLLVQLVAIKIVATSLCRASGLVGGYYAPSLFIGAATGMAYGKFISFAIAQSNPILNLSILEVASPQAYGLVGMAATLAGVCQVPLTAVLLLFELTQDYRIVLPLLGAVGLSSWITSGQTKRGDFRDAKKLKERNTRTTQKPKISSPNRSGISPSYSLDEKAFYESNICEVESLLWMDDPNFEINELKKGIYVSQAMRTRYVSVLMSTLLTEAVTLMLVEKQSCAVIVDNDNLLIGLLTLGDVQEFSKGAKASSRRPKEILVSEMCSLDGEKCRVSWTATPGMDLLSAQMIMNKHGVSQLPVVSDHVEDHQRYPVGIIDRECISLACRVVATRERLSKFSILEKHES